MARAHLTAALASVAHDPGSVLQNLLEAQHERTLAARGRYGFSNVNLDRNWVSRDMVGIDAGAAVLAVDNYLVNNRVRQVFKRSRVCGAASSAWALRAWSGRRRKQRPSQNRLV